MTVHLDGHDVARGPALGRRGNSDLLDGDVACGLPCSRLSLRGEATTPGPIASNGGFRRPPSRATQRRVVSR